VTYIIAILVFIFRHVSIREFHKIRGKRRNSIKLIQKLIMVR
jgi:hypothetical protein